MREDLIDTLNRYTDLLWLTTDPVARKSIEDMAAYYRAKLAAMAPSGEAARIMEHASDRHTASEHMPSLLRSGHPDAPKRSPDLGDRDSGRPVLLKDLHSQGVQIIEEVTQSIRRVTSSAIRLRATAEALATAIAGSIG